MALPSALDRASEMDLWKRYKGGDQTALQPLMDRFKPTVSKWVTQYASPNVPAVTLRVTAQTNLKKALDSYNPMHTGATGQVASLNTHVTWGLRKGTRLLQKYSNIARIPEPRGLLIGEYNRAKAALQEKLNRPPSIAEIRDFIAADLTIDPAKRQKLSLKTIERLEKEMRTDRPYSDTMASFSEQHESDTDELLSRDLLYNSLAPEDQVIFEHAFGYGGKPVLPNVRIAKLVGVSPTTVGKKIRKFKGQFQELIA